MRVLVTGACGFAGSEVLRRFRELAEGWELHGLDNFCRPGSERNRAALKQMGVRLVHGDVRLASDFEALPAVDWVVDAAAQPSVLAGVDGRTSSRQLIEHNLLGTVNMLEHCRRHGAGFILLSTSRVYSVPALAGLPLAVAGPRFALDASRPWPAGLSAAGVGEAFSTTAPVSLYGASKRASEDLALEFAHAFGLPVWINRCGVLAGAGQFGRPDQGIVACWIHSWREGRPLKYLGFGGHGWQVRDALHPADLAALLHAQMTRPATAAPRLAHVSGGLESSFSLAELSEWCRARFGREVPVEQSGEERRFDAGWIVLDSSVARDAWQWAPQIGREEIFAGIARFAEAEPRWMDLAAG